MKIFLKLQWLLKFIQADLDKLGEAEIRKLSRELVNILSITGVSLFNKDDKLDDKLMEIALDSQTGNNAVIDLINSLQEHPENIEISEIKKTLQNAKPGLSQAFNSLIRSIQRQKGEDKNGALPLWEEVGSVDTKVNIKCFLEGPGIPDTNLFIPLDTIQQINEVAQKLHDKFGESLYQKSKPFNERKIRGSYTTSDNLTDNVLLHFFNSLNDIPVGAFYQCPECNKWFIHTSKRKKTYCTNKCAAKSGGRKKRGIIKKQDPESHAKICIEGNRRARKSYVEKAKQGNPNTKVGRKPHKHKKEN